MKTTITHLFEGQQRTMAEIRAMVPRIKSPSTIHNHLDAGRRTVIAMMSFDPKLPSIAASRRSYSARGKPSILRGAPMKDWQGTTEEIREAIEATLGEAA